MSESHDLGPLPQCHEREAVYASASNELRLFLTELRKKHSLTSAEYTAMVASEAHAFANRLVGIERRRSESPSGCDQPDRVHGISPVQIISAINATIKEVIARGLEPGWAVLTDGCYRILSEYLRGHPRRFEPKDIGFCWRPECPCDSVGVTVVNMPHATLYTRIDSVPEKS